MSYDPTAPASEDTRPLAILVGNGAGCHECGRTHTGRVQIGRYKVPHCPFHREIVERTVRLTLAANRVADRRRATAGR